MEGCGIWERVVERGGGDGTLVLLALLDDLAHERRHGENYIIFRFVFNCPYPHRLCRIQCVVGTVPGSCAHL